MKRAASTKYHTEHCFGHTSVVECETNIFLDDHSEYYRYTAGRYAVGCLMSPSSLRLATIRFNINSLAEVAAKYVGSEPSSCIKIGKLPEGNFNKSLLLTMANGSQLVARVFNPNLTKSRILLFGTTRGRELRDSKHLLCRQISKSLTRMQSSVQRSCW